MKKWLIYALIFIAPLIFFTDLTRNPYYFQIVLLNISVIFLWGIYLLDGLRKKKTVLFSTPLDKPLLIFLLLAIVSWLHSFFLSHPGFAQNGLYISFHPELKLSIFSEGSRNFLFLLVNWFLVYYAAIFFLEKKEFVWKVIRLSYFTAVVASVYGILQYFSIELIWPKVLNPFGGRCVSTFGNPNFLSPFLVLVLPLTFTEYLLSEKKNMRLFYFLINFILFWALICTMTRSSWLGLFLGLLYLFFNLARYQKVFIQKNKARLGLLLSLFILFAIFSPRSKVTGYAPSVIERLTEIKEAKKATYGPLHQRFLIWFCAWEMVKERFLLGKGWGTFELFYPFYQGKYLFWERYESFRTHANNAHNEILEIISQTGVIGLGIFLWLWITFYRWVHSLYKYPLETKEKMLVFAISAGITAFLVDNILNVSLHFAIPAFFFFWYLGILANFAIQREKNSGINLSLKNKTWLVSLILLFFVLLIVNNARFFLAEIHYFNGFKFNRQNRLLEAKKELETAHQYHRLEVNNNYELGNTYARLGEQAKAIWAYKEALAANLGYDEIYYNLAVVSLYSGKVEEAIKNYQQALYINPLSREAYLSLGNLYLRQPEKYLEKGIKVYDRVVELDPLHKESWNNLGYLYLKNNQPEKAINCFREALRIDPNFELARRNLSTIEQKNRK
ncbi:MAG TPA: hypothetical protein DHV62_08875 [Elusimicrobia bacterium]|jgi:O-antigen ligase/Tfp pilus assembly protein PilF|nr:hypothetical protein [Elusimicrobiota bacterium]